MSFMYCYYPLILVIILKGVGQYNNDSLKPVKESLKQTTEVLILLFVRNDGWDKRQFVRSTIGQINEYQNITHKYQVLFVFGTGSFPTENQMSDWRNEIALFNDIILLGKQKGES